MKSSTQPNEIICFEELSMNAQLSIKTQLYDGWVLRFSNGYTNRANSVNPLYSSTLPFEEKVPVCEKTYFGQNLPTVFKLTPASPVGLDEFLDKNGYEIVTPTYVMKKDIAEESSIAAFKEGNTVIQSKMDSDWCNAFFIFNGITDDNKISTALTMMRNIQNNVLYAKIEASGTTVACGLCVVERNYAGLFDIVVDSSYRGRGYGHELCSALLNSARELGATVAYLQVVAANAPAIALYQKLGFERCYDYWYRIKKG